MRKNRPVQSSARTESPTGANTVLARTRFPAKQLKVYANNAAALAGGLRVGDYYRTGADPDPVCVVH